MLKLLTLVLLSVMCCDVAAQSFKDQLLQPVKDHYVEQRKQDAFLPYADSLKEVATDTITHEQRLYMKWHNSRDSVKAYAGPLLHQPIIIIDTFHVLTDGCDSVVKRDGLMLYNHMPSNYNELNNCYMLFAVTVEYAMLKLTFYQHREIPAFGMCYFYYKMNGRTAEFRKVKCYESTQW